MEPAISQACRDKIVEFEVGSRAYYEKFANRPVWPGGASGITIGIGYDLGQHTVQEFIDDWTGFTAVNASPTLQAVCGHTGANAKWILHTVADTTISYAAAIDVFDRVVLPRYIRSTVKAFPNSERLPMDALGALVDLVYNRGPSVSAPDDRRVEMLAIRNHLAVMNVSAIPGFIRSMKRQWPNSKGLLARRDWEADTFERAIATDVVASAPTKPAPVAPKPKPRAAPKVIISQEPQADDNVSDQLNDPELARVRRINQ